MKLLLRTLRYIYCVYALLTFVLLMFIVLPFVIFSLLFGKVTGGNMIYQLCRFWATVWYLMIGIRHKEIYEAPHDRSRQYIFVANHISYMDIPPIVLIAHQPVAPKVKRLLQLGTTFQSTHFTYIIDDFKTAQVLSKLFTANTK